MFEDNGMFGLLKLNSFLHLIQQQKYFELIGLGLLFLMYSSMSQVYITWPLVYKNVVALQYYGIGCCTAYEIEIEGERVITRGVYHKDVCSYFTSSFQGIWNRIAILEPSVKKLKETVNLTQDNEHKPSASVLTSNETFIVMQPFCFYLEDHIYAEVECWENTHGSDDKETNNRERGSIRTIKYVIRLFSYIHDTYYLKKYIQLWENHYLEEQEKERNEKLYMYMLRKADIEDKRIQWHESEFKSNKTFSTLFFKQKQEVLQKIHFFLNNEEWYAKEGLPYTLGICLRGPPGTGKTSFIKSLVNEVRRTVVVILLNMIKTEEELYEVYFDEKYNKRNKKPIEFKDKILVIEDIDCMIDVIKSREYQKEDKNQWTLPTVHTLPNMSMLQNKLGGGKRQPIDRKTIDEAVQLFKPTPTFTLSFLLNLLDGLQESHGRILIITTNCYDEIDPALVRHGRIDLTIDMNNADVDTLQAFYEHYYNEPMPDKYVSQLENIEIMPSLLVNLRKESKTKFEFLELLLNHNKK